MRKEHCHCLIIILIHLLANMYFKWNGISYFTSYLYQIFTLCSCEWLLDSDFKFSIFKDQNALSFKKILIGAAYGFGFAVAVIVFFALVSEVTLFPQYVFEMTGGMIFNQIIFQLLVALAEESMYRFYLYEELLHLRIPRWIAALVLSLLFASVHFYHNGRWMQFGIALVFSLATFRIKIKSRGNSYLLLAAMHFTYDLCCCFIFTI